MENLINNTTYEYTFSATEYLEINQIFDEYMNTFNEYYLAENFENPSHFWDKIILLEYNNVHLIQTTEQFDMGQTLKIYKNNGNFIFIKNDVDDIATCKYSVIDNLQNLLKEIDDVLKNSLHVRSII